VKRGWWDGYLLGEFEALVVEPAMPQAGTRGQG
jgi:hypothetical protein